MPAFRPRLRALAVGIAAFALVAVAAGGTLAASTNPPVLYACFNTSGAVAMSTIAQCKLAGGGQLAYWSTQGVPGPTGATGATGTTGATGSQGPAGSGADTFVLTLPVDSQLHTMWLGPGWNVVLKCAGSETGIYLSVPIGSSATPQYSDVGRSFDFWADEGTAGAGGLIGDTFIDWVDFSATDGTAAVRYVIHKVAYGVPVGFCRFMVTG